MSVVLNQGGPAVSVTVTAGEVAAMVPVKSPTVTVADVGV